MIIPDIYRLNDWGLRRFNISILSLLICYDFSVVSNQIISNQLIYNSNVLISIFGFILLSFVPGYIILRILKGHNIERVTNFLLAVGLSISFIMMFGFCINIFLPYIGISKPISTFPLFYAFNIIVLILLIVCNLCDNKFKPLQNNLYITLSPMLLFLILLPILSVFGTYSMNYYNFNLLIMILLLILSLFPLLVVLDKLQENLYPLSIFLISISLLYSINLITLHLWSYDIFFEAYTTNYVLQNGVWNPNTSSIMPLLLFTILSPIYSLICNLNSIWVFKIIFPFLSSLTPLILYQVYKKLDFGNYKFDSKMAILSVFVFTFYYGFFKSMPDKQHIAELFLGFILMLFGMDIQNRIILLLIFSFSLITSHYGVSYLIMISFIFIQFIVKFLNIHIKNKILTPNFTLLFFIFALSWYIYVSNGYIFENIIHIGNHLLGSISEILQPDERTGVTYILYESQSGLWKFYKLTHICLQFFIFVGFFNLLKFVLKEKENPSEIAILSIPFYAFLLFQTIKSYGLGFDRTLQITLILLSPLALWGLFTIIEFLSLYINCFLGRSKFNRISESDFTLKYNFNVKTDSYLYKRSQLFFAIFLIVFFLLNSGVGFEITGDELPGYSINLNTSAGWPAYSESEVCCIDWLKSVKGESNISLFNKWSGIKSRDGLLVSEQFYSKDLIPITANTTKLNNTYIFLGKYSINKVELGEQEVKLENTDFYKHILKSSIKIYNSGNANLYLDK